MDGIKRYEEGVQVIAGTNARLRVTGKERIVSPAKGLIREIRAGAGFRHSRILSEFKAGCNLRITALLWNSGDALSGFVFRFRDPVEDPAAVLAEVDLALVPDLVQHLGPDAHVA